MSYSCSECGTIIMEDDTSVCSKCKKDNIKFHKWLASKSNYNYIDGGFQKNKSIFIYMLEDVMNDIMFQAVEKINTSHKGIYISMDYLYWEVDGYGKDNIFHWPKNSGMQGALIKALKFIHDQEK